MRVLDPDVYDDTVRLKEESSTYCEKISQMISAGDEAVSKVQGDTKYFPKTKEEYINWWREAEADAGKRSSQFTDKPVEPFTK